MLLLFFSYTNSAKLRIQKKLALASRFLHGAGDENRTHVVSLEG